jgi:prepilin-type N-terminal cleavage/methylation domain-containing protein
MMIRNERGFSLVELMITMVVFVLVIAASSQVFTALLTQFKQQSKIGESNIEGIVGLDILRRDLAGAGFGLPQNLSGATYNEASDDPLNQTAWIDRDYNDGPPVNTPISRGWPSTSETITSTSSPFPPGAVRSGPRTGMDSRSNVLDRTDLLVIKSASVAFDEGAQKWSYISNRGSWTTIKGWGSGSGENLASADRVIVVNPNASSKTNDLVLNGASFFSQWGTNGAALPAALKPDLNSYQNYVAYGVDSNNDPRMPFNRADYYVKVPTTGSMPSRCALNTGVLYKGVLNQSDGNHTELPLIDCVVTMKVDYWLDSDGNGIVDWNPPDSHGVTPFSANDKVQSGVTPPYSPTNDINILTAAEIRSMLKEVRVYIVAQEGQRDQNYDFSQGGTVEKVTVTEYFGNQSRDLELVDLHRIFGNYDYKYYHWKVYTIAVQPNNLR